MTAFVFEVFDPRLRKVTLTYSCYNDHILRSHPELTDVNIIKAVVEAPDWIAADVKEDDVEIYYKRGALRAYPKVWLRVVVRRENVVTAYLVARLKQGEKIVWMPGSSSARRSR